MPADERKAVPIHPAADAATGGCGAAEPFALMVLGDAMAPEFVDGDVVVVEPEGYATDGSFVVAHVDGEWTLRQLVRRDGRWWLAAFAPAHPPTALADLGCVRGVVIQKSRPGRRRSVKRYVE